MQPDITELVGRIAETASPVLRVHGFGGRPWLRDVSRPGDTRRGPWLQARYDVVDQALFKRRGACLYLVLGNDGRVRYVGRSIVSFATRWAARPALDAETGQVLPNKELFHSQCWRHMQAECARTPGVWFEVRAITSPELTKVLAAVGGQLGSLALAPNVVVAVEDRLLAHRAILALWNAR